MSNRPRQRLARLCLIDDILEFSKIEAGKLQTEIVECSLTDLLDGIADLIGAAAVRRNLDSAIRRQEPLPDLICTDPIRLRQCLLNLLNNALKFTEVGHVHLLVTREGAFPRFDVEDTGVGIPAEKLPSIFSEFTQADNSTTRQYGGTGLGLTITRELCQLLGGGVSVRSELGRGSVFTMRVLAGVDLGAEQAPELKEEESIGSERGPRESSTPAVASAAHDTFVGRVLVAEDTLSNQVLIELLLTKSGLKVQLVENGKSAVQEGLANDYDLILMDMQMPIMNGFEATRELRAGGYKGPIVALTASAMEGDRRKCLDAGCTDYLSKPLSRPELTGVLAEHLPRRAAPVSNS